MNSLLHGFDEGQSGGKMKIQAAWVPSNEGEPSEVELRYSDNGKGIPAANLPKIFDPFLTTKRGAGGTGLGLHIVFNIVTQTLGGMLQVESAEGLGTTFICRLPRKVRDAIEE